MSAIVIVVVCVIASISTNSSHKHATPPPPPPTIEEMGVRIGSEEEAELSSNGTGSWFWSAGKEGKDHVVGGKKVGEE